MVFPVVGGDGKPTGYEISNSFRFDDASSSFLQRTNGANTGEDNATLSFWFKIGNLKGANNGGTIFCEGNTSGDHVMQIYANKIYIGSENFSLMYPNLIRDPSAWYHLFVAFDSTQGTAANRVKPYLNGVLLENPTTFTTYPDQNENLNITKNGTTTRIGGRGNSGDESFDGYLAEFHYLDGTTKAYTDFGEFNDNGVWIPKKYIGGSYGDNGFFLEFKQTGGSADASGLGADTSGEGHHFSGDNVVGATDVTTDTPTNNFAVLLPNGLINSNGDFATFDGNTRFIGDGSDGWNTTHASLGFSKGKWYWEQKFTQITGGASFAGLVKDDVDHSDNDISGQDDNEGVLYYANAGKYMFGNGGTYESDGEAFGASFDDGDIISVAADLDNNKMYFAKNGTYQGSGNPSTGSNGLPISEGSYGLVAGSFTFVFPYAGAYYANDGCEFNFGNPSFAISSGNSDANGYGNFEYAVPTGFYALCTKNLAEYG